MPDDVSIKKDWEKKIKDAKEYVRRLNVVSLQEAGKEIIEEKEDEQAKVIIIVTKWFSENCRVFTLFLKLVQRLASRVETEYQ